MTDSALSYDDEDDDDSSDDEQRQEGDQIANFLAGIITRIPKPLFGIRGRMFKAMARASIRNYHKTAGGDAIGINAKPGQQIELIPVKYQSPEETDEGGRPGWKAKGREKTWNPGTEGNSVNYLGRTPTILLQDDDHVEAGWLAPRIGEAIELDQYSPLFVGNDFRVDVDYGSGANVSTDGGNPSRVRFDLETLGQWAGDNVIDLSSGSGHDGMRISTAKAREWRAEKSDSEHMQMQEDRGYLRGLANGDGGPGVLKLLLICGAIILGTLAIVLLGPKLVGGSGESVSGPLMSTLSLMIGLG
jgi:hypothetical protein